LMPVYHSLVLSLLADRSANMGKEIFPCNTRGPLLATFFG
jgi:hypothetical protein